MFNYLPFQESDDTVIAKVPEGASVRGLSRQ